MTKILVAEDDAQLNKILCACLSDRGYEATGCPDAAAALAKMDGTHYDMIVTDVMMPGMDGFAFAAAVRATDKKIPILFLTAREDLASKQRGYSIGIDDYVVKPVDFEELLLRIGALVLGTGMCLAMEIIGNLMPLGVAVGIAGIAMVSVNYFIYKAILRSGKKKYADEVIALSNDLLNE